MNKYLRGVVMAAIKLNQVSLVRQAGIDIYTVKDSKGKNLMTITDRWDYGQYSLDVNGKRVVDIKVNGIPKNQEEKDVLDIIRAVANRWTELADLQTAREVAKADAIKQDMNPVDRTVIDFLSKSFEH